MLLPKLTFKCQMYGNIGLATPRGSGTNGYVQRNLSHIRPRERDVRDEDDLRPIKHRAPDAGILEHERRRKVEVKCLELELELQDEGMDEAEIQDKVDELRKKLLAESKVEGASKHGTEKLGTHKLAELKEAELRKTRAAFGVSASYVEGNAFDKELQAEQRVKEKEEREK